MAGRIRSIKPEILEDEKTAQLSHLEFRLFVACILLADDYGNMRADAAFVRAQALWGVTDAGVADVTQALVVLSELGLLEPYEVRTQRYLHVKNWHRHQRVDKPGKPRVPGQQDPECVAVAGWKTYAVRLGDDGPIKIGKAFDVAKRIAKLQTAAPDKLRLVATFDRNIEADLHRQFSHLRRAGEWFEAAPEMLDALSEMARERFANHSRPAPHGPAPDLRSPISEKEGEGNGSPAPTRERIVDRSDPVVAALLVGDDLYPVAYVDDAELIATAGRIRRAVLDEPKAKRDGLTPEQATQEAVAAAREWRRTKTGATPEATLARVETFVVRFILGDVRSDKRRRSPDGRSDLGSQSPAIAEDSRVSEVRLAAEADAERVRGEREREKAVAEARDPKVQARRAEQIANLGKTRDVDQSRRAERAAERPPSEPARPTFELPKKAGAA